MPKLIAHRGWSIGQGNNWRENTLGAFKKSAEHNEIMGVEIDIRRHPKTGEVVLSHDPPTPRQEPCTLSEALEFIDKQSWYVLIEFKEYDVPLFTEVTALIKEYRLSDKSLVFGFENIVKDFPWHQDIHSNMGIIVEYPWHINMVIKKYNPHTILLGWDERWWTSIAFKLWWSFFSLANLSKQHGVDIIGGVAKDRNDTRWFKNTVVTMYTADMQKIV